MGAIGEYLPIRYLVISTAFLGFMFNYGLRVNMSIAIVAMVNHTAIMQLSSSSPSTSNRTSSTPFENLKSQCIIGIKSYNDSFNLPHLAEPEEKTNGSILDNNGLAVEIMVTTPISSTLFPPTVTDPSISDEGGRSSTQIPEPHSNDQPTSKKSSDGPLVWDEAVQGLVLSSFYWGYIVTQMPGGRMAEIFGPKHVLSVSLLGTALVTMFMPLAAKAHYSLAMALRIIMGLLEGASYPAISVLLAKWAPVAERSRMTAIVFVGSMFGTFVILPIAGILIESFGWESVFYFSGLSTIAWGVLWVTIVKNDPQEHPWITEAELRTIKGSKYKPLKTSSTTENSITSATDCTGSGINTAMVAVGNPANNLQHKKTIPWRAMIRCKPLWALTIASAGHGYGFTVILSLMPSYLKTMQGFDIKSNGTLSALPYLGRTIFGLLFSVFIDWQLKKAWFSRTALRKFAVSIAYLTAGTALLLTSFSGCHAELTVALLILTITAVGADYSGTAPSYLDLCSNYAGTALGFANGAFTFSAIIAPIISGYILKGQQNLATWGTVFRIGGAIYIAVDIVYLIWGSAEEEPWNQQQTLTEEGQQHALDDKSCPSDDFQATTLSLINDDSSAVGISDDAAMPMTPGGADDDAETSSGMQMADDIVHVRDGEGRKGNNKTSSNDVRGSSSSSSSRSEADEIDSSHAVT